MIVFKNETSRHEETCSVIWFHTESHTALEIDKTLYNLFLKCVESQSTNYSDKKARALEGKGRPYYQFHIGITAEEKKQMLNEWEELGFNTCSGNAARLLEKTAGIELPKLSWVPAYYAEHLYKMREQVGSRIVSIEYVGNEPDQEICKTLERKKWDEWDKIPYSINLIFLFMFLGYIEYLLKNS